MADKPALIRLADSELMLANPADDVRGLKVLDTNGDKVGDVDGIIIDEQERRARFLEVGSGGFLGIGETKRLVPVEAVTAVDEDVHIDTTRESVAASGEFDPKLMPGPEYYQDIYGHYDRLPFWTPGYVDPGYPWRSR